MGLTREVCSLKLVESQLLASMAAANANADASAAKAERLLLALNESQRALQRAQRDPCTPRQRGSDARHSAAELNAQLVARAQDLYTAQDRLLQVRPTPGRHFAPCYF